jgi:very-short-patch-repair endonuclease
MRPPDPTVEQVLARLGGRAYGVVTREQLLAAGVTDGEIKRRVRRGALLREHRGVYRVGHRAASVEATYLAAVWACGGGSALSGEAGAHLVRIRKRPPSVPEVTTPNDRRTIAGVRIRRTRGLEPWEVTTIRAIPVTTVPRTLVDLAATLPAADLARACHEAGVLYGTTPRHIDRVLRRRPTSPGAAKLRAVMSGDERVTLSDLERRFLALLREANLPLPITNRPAGTKRVDCRWPEHRLTVELDSYTYHRSRHAWEQDRRREREAHARGDDLRRYTRGEVYDEPGTVLGELGPLLA